LPREIDRPVSSSGSKISGFSAHPMSPLSVGSRARYLRCRRLWRLRRQLRTRRPLGWDSLHCTGGLGGISGLLARASQTRRRPPHRLRNFVRL
jgi:hypothetical protein